MVGLRVVASHEIAAPALRDARFRRPWLRSSLEAMQFSGSRGVGNDGALPRSVPQDLDAQRLEKAIGRRVGELVN